MYLDEVYSKLGTKEGENDIYKLARIRERKCRDLNQVRCVKDENDKVLTKDNDIRERWKSYFEKLYNEGYTIGLENLRFTTEPKVMYTRNIRVSEVKIALKKMSMGKACGPDDIPIEVWKVLGEVGVI